jgi:hypothetical protein
VAPGGCPAGALAPELEPDEPELEPEPMSGHGPLPVVLGEPDFEVVPDCPGGVDGFVLVDGAVVLVLVLVLVPVVLVELVPVALALGAAEAPAMPAMAPPVASAPATIVAPSILDTFIGLTS